MSNQLAWAAGLFEGEGSMGLKGFGPPRKDGTKKLYPRMTLVSTDKDVVERFRDYMQCGTAYYRKPQKGGHKPSWVWEVNSKSARESINKIYPYLCGRRQAKAREVFGDLWQS